MHNYKILKNSGETELFDISKLRNSLLRSGASRDSTEKVLKELEVYLFDGMSTHKIYRKA